MANIYGSNGANGANGQSGTPGSFYVKNGHVMYIQPGPGQGGYMGGNGGVGATTLTNEGNIYGGNGGKGGSGGSTGTPVGKEHANVGGPGGAGGNGGIGLSLAGAGMYISTVNITGGRGGDGGAGGSGYTNGRGGSGGYGGTGVVLDGVTLTSFGAITAGRGGAAGSAGGHGGAGGDGVYLDDATLINRGSITGGYSDVEGGHYPPVGVGVYLRSSNLVTSGTIAGGHYVGGGQADAVLFGAYGGASSLTVEAGAVFDGQVAASTYYDDTLDLSGTQSGGTAITLGSQFTGFSSLNFDPGSAFKVDVGTGAASGAGLSVSGFAQGDTIDVTNISPKVLLGDFGATPVYSANGAYEFEGSSGGEKLTTSSDGTFLFGGNYSGQDFLLTPDGTGGTDVTVACFRKGTRISTEHGERPIEGLQIGDRVMTLTGRPERIRWIGRRHYAEALLAERPEMLPVLICAGALGDSLPIRDLWVSPEHALYLCGALVPASLLTNGVSILTDRSVTSVSYYHLEFQAHEVVFAEGVAAESFVDDDSRQMFDNADEFARCYPHEPRRCVVFCASRVEDGEELQIIRKRLSAGLRGLSFNRTGSLASVRGVTPRMP